MTTTSRKPDTTSAPLKPDEVRAFVADFPVLPPEVLRTLVSLAAPDYSFDRVATFLTDVSDLKERVLALANSPFFSPVEPILELPHAEVMIGKSQLRALIVGASMRPIFGPYCGYGYEANGFWRHSVAVATAAAFLAEEYGATDPQCARVYLAGLFHDCGKLVLSQLSQEKLIRLDLAATPDDPPGLVAVEREALGTDHCEVGAMVAAHWGLDESIQQVIAEHHQPGAAAGLEVATLHFADYMINNLGVGTREELPSESPLDCLSLGCFEDDPEFLPNCEALVLREVARVLACLEVLE